MLITIKVAHTAIWAVLAVAILALPVLALRSRFKWAIIVTAAILTECGVLAFNGGRCPLTDLAALYTDNRAANFDIYLPVWLAANNKTIFGALFLAGEMFLLFCWLRHHRSLRR
ncbi:MAG TPA: hypothetical protein VFA68_05175 [Terriglobales bacterium]|nr:hypothetical protein [Terriglobales bacterium]